MRHSVAVFDDMGLIYLDSKNLTSTVPCKHRITNKKSYAENVLSATFLLLTKKSRGQIGDCLSHR